MIRPRSRRRNRFPIVPVLAIALLAGAGWIFWPKSTPGSTSQPAPAEPPPPTAAAKTPASGPAEFTPPWGNEEKLEPRDAAGRPAAIPVAVLPDPSATTGSPADNSDATSGKTASDANPEKRIGADKPASPPTVRPPISPEPPTGPFADRLAAVVRQYQAGERIDARHRLNAMLGGNNSPAEAAELRKQLAAFTEETIFSRLRVPNDPLVEECRVQPKETLIDIATRYDIPHQAILLVNPGLDPRKLRAGMDLKVPRGPFHLKVSKAAFRLDLYLQDLYVRSFPVGLGGETDTPTGVWRITDRQVDPTYYPPSTATDKRVIPGKDPRNPLGAFYLKLEGVEGEALGRTGFAVHGTNDPDSIGKAESLGCIRMLNEDVEYLYKLVRSQKSLVTISP